jgi:hypothetical protein
MLDVVWFMTPERPLKPERLRVFLEADGLEILFEGGLELLVRGAWGLGRLAIHAVLLLLHLH